MTDGELKTFREPNDILRHLRVRHDGYLLVNVAEIVGTWESSPGQTDVALFLRGEESTSQYTVPIFEAEKLVALAKEILRHFDPSAIDPDSQIHQSLRRIEEKLGTLPDS